MHAALQRTTSPKLHRVSDVHDDSAWNGSDKLPFPVVSVENLKTADGLIEE